MAEPSITFQSRVQPWLMACFGEMIAGDREERNHRFLEEALELVQACGCTADEAHQLVDYVFGRPAGEKGHEVGGVMVTMAALCLAQDLDLHDEAETELTRIWTRVEQIRAKQAAKPKYSPLPVSAAVPPSLPAMKAAVELEIEAAIGRVTTRSIGEMIDRVAEARVREAVGQIPALAALLVNEIDDLIGESEGVAGLHRNGDVATWADLEPGGEYERLTSLNDLRAALAQGEVARG